MCPRIRAVLAPRVMTGRALIVLLSLSATLGCATPSIPRAAVAPRPPPPLPTPPAASLPTQPAALAWSGAALVATYPAPPAWTAPLRELLWSGLPSGIATRVYVFRDGSDAPVALAVRLCYVRFDLWDGVFVVDVTGAGGQESSSAVDEAGLTRLCVDASALPIVDRALLVNDAGYFLAVETDVNPRPRTYVAVQHWAALPAGRTAIGLTDSLFVNLGSWSAAPTSGGSVPVRFRTEAFVPARVTVATEGTR